MGMDKMVGLGGEIIIVISMAVRMNLSIRFDSSSYYYSFVWIRMYS